MREILFRGRRTDNREWIYGGYFYENGKHMIQTNSFYSEVISESVGEFTGLYDKNNVRIFEGDIVKTIRYGSRINYWTVKFNCGSFAFVDGENCISPSTFDYDYVDFSEVVGNIFDSQELLKEET